MRSISLTKKLGLATLGLLVASVSTVHAQDADADAKAIENRQAVFKLIGWSFDPVGKMLKNQMKYDAATVQKSAAASKCSPRWSRKRSPSIRAARRLA